MHLAKGKCSSLDYGKSSINIVIPIVAFPL